MHAMHVTISYRHKAISLSLSLSLSLCATRIAFSSATFHSLLFPFSNVRLKFGLLAPNCELILQWGSRPERSVFSVFEALRGQIIKSLRRRSTS